MVLRLSRAVVLSASVIVLVSSPVFAGPPASKPKSKPAAPAPVPDRSSRGYHLAQTALSYRGTPYRWGGTVLGKGVDCSGLVQAVCAKWGILLPRAARAQYTVGVPIKPENLQAGDLVFFKNTYRRGLSHVGIYVGENCFIHAAGRGKGVCLSRLDVGYHKKHWAGARRLDLSKLPATEGEQAVTPDRVYLDPTGDVPASETDIGN